MTATSATGERVRGFTLIELLVALAIMVLIASSVPVALNRMLPSRRVAVAADRLVADLQWLRSESIRMQAPGQLTVLPDGYRMEVGHSQQNISLADTMRIQLRAREGERELQQLMFFPDGTASPVRIAVGDSGRNVDLEVGMLTGRVNKVR
jgi:type II secretion system protein H